MDNSAVLNSQSWYAIQTRLRQEDRADNNLRAWQVETFCPKLRTQRRNPFGGRRPMIVNEHLFPGYIFARFDVRVALHKISFTRGVKSVVSLGSAPTPVDDGVISLIKSRLSGEANGDGPLFKKGVRVQVVDGPLKNLEGIFEREIPGAERVQILLAAVKYQAMIVVDSWQVRPAS
jgi:transcriptional antiterminator RfaH